MILVTGANGQFAGAAIRNLQGLGANFKVATRNPYSEFAQGLTAVGIKVVHADFDEPLTVEQAMENVEKVLVIPTMSPNDVRFEQNKTVVNAAKAAGVSQIVYASFINASANSICNHNRIVHYPTEQAIMASGISYTILRHALYADSWMLDLERILASGEFARPGGAVASVFIPRADLGFSAAKVLTSPGHEGAVYTETMPEALTGAQYAEVIGDVFETKVKYREISSGDWPEYMHRNWGFPMNAAQDVMSTMRALEVGEFNIVTDDFATINGFNSRNWRTFLSDMRDTMR